MAFVRAIYKTKSDPLVDDVVSDLYQVVDAIVATYEACGDRRERRFTEASTGDFFIALGENAYQLTCDRGHDQGLQL